jgi:pimeloyl-ACP methyl ester carboxylesterase
MIQRSRTITANGLSFRIDECGEGEDVALLLHGFPENRFAWRAQLEPLAQAGWRVAAPDLRGYGDSDRPKGKEAYALDHLVADVDGLFRSLGARRRLLIGHDWGGLIAWTYAMSADYAPLDGLVVMNAPHPAVLRTVMRRSWAQRARSWYAAFFQIPWAPEAILTAGGAWFVGAAIRGMAVDKSAFPPELLARYRASALRPGAMKAMIDYYRANLGVLADPTGPRRMIEVPTLLIWGEEDRALGLELTEGYEAFVRTLELQRLPGTSHWVQQEAPVKVNALLLDWLNRQAFQRRPSGPAAGAGGAATDDDETDVHAVAL